MNALKSLTDAQLHRLERRLNARIRAWSAGDPYGWDMATLKLCCPGLAHDYGRVLYEQGWRAGDRERHTRSGRSLEEIRHHARTTQLLRHFL